MLRRTATAGDRNGKACAFNRVSKELWLSAKAALSDYAETSIRGCYHIDAMLDPELLRQAIRCTLHFTPLPATLLCQDEEEPCFIVGEPQA